MAVRVLSEMAMPEQVEGQVALALVVQVVVQVVRIKIMRKTQALQERSERLEMAAAAAAAVQGETNVIQITPEMVVLVALLLVTMEALQVLRETMAIREETAAVVVVVPPVQLGLKAQMVLKVNILVVFGPQAVKAQLV
jgi:hypothetical protein